MTTQGKLNYEAYRKASKGVSLISGVQLPEYDDMPPAIRHAWDSGADAVEGFLASLPVDEDMPGTSPGPRRSSSSTRQADASGATVPPTGTSAAPCESEGGNAVAIYAPGAWLSAREDGSIADDLQAEALGVATRALSSIYGLAHGEDGDEGQDLGKVIQLADDALAALAGLGFE